MIGFPGGFVGFFESLSDILKGLGTEWTQHSKDENDNAAKNWGEVFLETSAVVKNVADAFVKIRDEHDLREKERSEENPAELIQNFKNRVLKEAKNGR